MIASLSPSEALGRVARSVHLAEASETDVPSDALLAQVIRRAVNVMAPCAAHELAGAVAQSFACVSRADQSLADRINKMIEDLIVYGDILEMREADDEVWPNAKGFVLRPAPPSFVKRRNGSVAILGVAGDQITPLTAELDARVAHHGPLRVIPRSGDDDVESLLVELGLLKLPENTWLRLPPFESADAHLASWRKLLASEPASVSIEGLQILDTARPPTYYKDRWVQPGRAHSGMYVGRRPQRYGAPLWCLVDLESGAARRFKDLSLRGDRQRPFDIAWRLQAALDNAAGNPQRYEASEFDPATSVLRFFSPVPSWCERQLTIAGQKVAAERCLFAFHIPAVQLADEIAMLRELLWMKERT